MIECRCLSVAQFVSLLQPAICSAHRDMATDEEGTRSRDDLFGDCLLPVSVAIAAGTDGIPSDPTHTRCCFVRAWYQTGLLAQIALHTGLVS